VLYLLKIWLEIFIRLPFKEVAWGIPKGERLWLIGAFLAESNGALRKCPNKLWRFYQNVPAASPVKV